VRKPDGTDCAPDEAGEILIRGFCVMRGYYGDPEATKAAIDPDGWLHTGDLGSFDSRGNLRIVGRLKDVIIVGGFNVYPAEVERVLAEHPAVSDAALVGHPDERLGEVPVAWVELAAPAEPAELIAWCRERVANFKVPREVVIVNALPRNAMGKVRKAELRRA
jgi:acyl-CoA synthetase (AMP-forming)/AMP-acid ligase II